MLHGKILKLNNETCLKCEYQLKQKNMSREKMLQLVKCLFLKEKDLNLRT